MLCADYNATTPRATLRFAPNLGFDPVTTAFSIDSLALDGQIQRATIPFTGEDHRISPYDEACQLTFEHIFQLETYDGVNYWHGYLEVDLIDDENEDFTAIDFIEIAINQDALSGYGTNPLPPRFDTIRLGDVDGFGWGDGQALTDCDPSIRSANNDDDNPGEKQAINVDGIGVLGVGDFLPDINADGDVEAHSGDDWDNRSADERGGRFLTGTGYVPNEIGNFPLGSQYTDITLSTSYHESAALATDPVLQGDLARTYGQFPSAEAELYENNAYYYEINGQHNLPGDGNNPPFVFDCYLDPFVIDPQAPLYINIVHAGLDPQNVQLRLKTRNNRLALLPLVALATTNTGEIQSAYARIDNTTDITPQDVLTWVPAGITLPTGQQDGAWHANVEVALLPVDDDDQPTYFAIDYIELTANQKNNQLIFVPQDYPTIQEAIDAAEDRTTIIVAPGTYRENLNGFGKDISLRSTNPLDPQIVATTILDGDIDQDGTGDGPVITNINGLQSSIAGFTIQNGNATHGGGIAYSFATIEHNVIKNNTANFGGGLANCYGVIRHNTIFGNTAVTGVETDEDPEQPDIIYGGHGGAVYNCPNLTANTIYNNSAELAGGAVYLGTYNHAQWGIANNIIYDNSITDTTQTEPTGAGIHLTDTAANAMVLHNTIIDNTIGTDVVNAIDLSSDAQWFNNIIQDTSRNATAPDTDWDRLANAELWFNAITGAPLKGSDPYQNFGDNPLFTNAATHVYTLTENSPAVDAAYPNPPALGTDHTAGVRSTETPDIGAIESPYIAPTPGLMTIQLPESVEADQPLSLSPDINDTLQGLIDNATTVTYQWFLNGEAIDGATDQTYTIDALHPDHAGSYTLTVTVDGTSYSTPRTTLDVRVSATSTLLLDPGEGNRTDEDGSPWNFKVADNFYWLSWMDTGEVREIEFELHNIGYDPLYWSIDSMTGPIQLAFGSMGPNELTWEDSPHIVTFTVTAPNDGSGVGGSVTFSTPDGGIECFFAGQVKRPGDPVPTGFEDIRIVEITDQIQDEDGDYSPCIILENAADSPVNLHGWSLSDEPANAQKWLFPEVTIQPGEQLPVFASGKNRPTGPDSVVPGWLHTNFVWSEQSRYLECSKSVSWDEIATSTKNNDLCRGAEKFNLISLTASQKVIVVVAAIGLVVDRSIDVFDGHNYEITVSKGALRGRVRSHEDENGPLPGDLTIPTIAGKLTYAERLTALIVAGDNAYRRIGGNHYYEMYNPDVIQTAENILFDMGYNVEVIARGYAQDILGKMRESKVKVFVFYGHGNVECLLTRKNEKLYRLNPNAEKSCDSISTLLDEDGERKEFDFVMLNACTGLGEDLRSEIPGPEKFKKLTDIVKGWRVDFNATTLVASPQRAWAASIDSFSEVFWNSATYRGLEQISDYNDDWPVGEYFSLNSAYVDAQVNYLNMPIEEIDETAMSGRDLTWFSPYLPDVTVPLHVDKQGFIKYTSLNVLRYYREYVLVPLKKVSYVNP